MSPVFKIMIMLASHLLYIVDLRMNGGNTHFYKIAAAMLIFAGVTAFAPLFVLHAQELDAIVTDFQSTINIRRDGTVDITETIAIDFHVQASGYVRELSSLKPSGFLVGQPNLTFELLSVLRDGQPVGQPVNRVLSENEDISINIGNPDETITGPHTYVIHYTLNGILPVFTNADFFHWNVTGYEQGISVLKSSAVVNLPGPTIRYVECYAGADGQPNDKCDSTHMDTTAEFTTRKPLNSNEGMKILVAYQPDSSTTPTATTTNHFDLLGSPFRKVLAAIIVLAGILFSLRTLLKRSNDIH